jgi:hypothetical protein
MRSLYLGFAACSMLMASQALAQEATPPVAPKAEVPLEELWPYQTTIERFDRNGKPQKPSIAYFWMPPKIQNVRGLIVAQMTSAEKRLTKDPAIRQVATEENLGIVFFDPGFDALFNWIEGGAGQKLEKALGELAKLSNHPEVETAPLLTIGHSTGGIFARNIAYWKPERVLGIIHLKSGNLHQHVYDPKATLTGVPFVAINGELEEFGPEGGIRPEYGRETQWIMIRQAMLERRAKDPNLLMSLVVHPGGSHTNWSDELTHYCALFIRKVAQYRAPEKPGGAIRALPPESGWLTDSNIKSPQHKPAPYAEYTGDKSQAFWHFDREMAEATAQIHQKFEQKPAGITEGKS